MAQVATCAGTLSNANALSGGYYATCSTQWQFEDYDNFINASVDESQAGQLWSQIAFVLVLAWGINVIARKFRR